MEDSAKRAHLGMGSNLGDRQQFLVKGIAALGDRGIIPVRISSLYDTDPVGLVEQGNFLNLAVEVTWPGEPSKLLEHCLEVERACGRARGVRDGPRTLDLDILLCGDRILREPSLQVPHPRLHERRFVLVPLAEIAPAAVHPLFGISVAQLLERCPDTSGVRRLDGRLSLERVDPSGYNPAASRGKDE